jgi:serine/threonine-protein kinase
MSPEQARGRTVDKRSDVWAYGALLFEMLAGRRLFEGETASDVLASVLKSEPDWAALPAATPHRLRHLIARCLERDPRRRLRDIGEARLGLEAGLGIEPLVAAPIRARGIALWLAAAAILAGLSGIAVGRMASRPGPTEPRPRVRFLLDTGRPLLSASWHGFGGLAVSGDGLTLAYVAPDGAVERIFLRRMGSLETHALPGTEGASNPFFSPDGKWLGFFAERSLRKISLDGGAPVTLAPARDNRGGTWTEADEIVFSPDPGAPLLRIAAAGGSARPLTELDASRSEMSHRWPSLVAGANAVLLTVKTEGLQSFDDARVAVVSLAGGAPKRVLEGGTAASYSPSGHVVYARAGALLAVPFDAARLQVTGAPFTVLEAVSRSSATGSAHYALSRSGTLVSLPGSVDIDNRALVRVDADGRVETLTREVRPYGTVRTSPDGRRLAMWIGVANDEIWTFEIERGILTRLAQGAYNPVWSPDGQWVVYTMAGVQADVVRSRADGSGQPEVLLPRKRSDGDQLATAISPDGRLLAFTEDDAETGSDLWTLSLADGSRKLVLATRFNEQAAVFSPDGRALAFVSDETGRSEVYVQPFPGPGARRQVSVGGGWAPVWGRTAGEIFYQSGTSLMGVSLGAAGIEPATPREVLRGVLMFDPTTLADMVAPWGLGPGGRGFVMPQQLDQKQATTLTVDLNWAPEPSR